MIVKKTAAPATPSSPLLYNDKILDALALGLDPDTRVITFEGVIRSAKTVTATLLFHLLLQQSTSKFALIAAEDYDAIRTNILESAAGLMVLFPELYEYKRSEIGGYYVEAKVPHADGTVEIKEILLAGYSNASKWQKILGKDIEIILIDEVNIADKQFYDECIARQGATQHPVTIQTLNGDDPQHWVYTERINQSLIAGNCPVTTRADMDRYKVKLPGYYYMWFSFNDNPKLDEKRKRQLATSFPVGSYYHKTRILGERGVWGTMIFTDYMSDKLIVNLSMTDKESGRPIPGTVDPKWGLTKYVVSMDVAGNHAYNAIQLIGYNHDHSKGAIVDLDYWKNVDPHSNRRRGYDYMTERLILFLDRHKDKNILFVTIDNSEQPFINDLQNKIKRCEVIPSYKGTIIQRCRLMILLYTNQNLLINAPCVEVYRAYQSSKWVKGQEGKEREDLQDLAADLMDTTEYGVMPFRTSMSRGVTLTQ